NAAHQQRNGCDGAQDDIEQPLGLLGALEQFQGNDHAVIGLLVLAVEQIFDGQGGVDHRAWLFYFHRDVAQNHFLHFAAAGAALKDDFAIVSVDRFEREENAAAQVGSGAVESLIFGSRGGLAFHDPDDLIVPVFDPDGAAHGAVQGEQFGGHFGA